jgi:FkbM family methyltransferase
LAITPPFFKAQCLYDRRAKKCFNIRIRDGVDWTQMEHIYLSCDYDISSTSRFNEIMKYYESIIKNAKVPLIIDCGANIGLASKYFSQTYPDSKVVAIEPDVGNISMARVNNEGGNVDLFRAAISSEGGIGSLIDMGAANAFRVTRDGGAGDLSFITVNTITDSNSNCTPFIIKIDIEGFESDLFSGNIEWIDRFPIIVVELHDWMVPKSNISRNFLKAISSRDRDFIHFSGYVLSIENQFPSI